MEISQQEKRAIYNKFVSDPDWQIVDRVLRSYIDSLSSISTLETEGKTADEVFALVEGRKIAMKALSDFLSDMGILKVTVNKLNESSNFR